ncbi:prepilin peptidase [Aeromonas simiae]|uniref:prepilin peptidase n=1 Tax=Aeromonas simiae TaxID=218936 RepID=UPI00266D9940|nr:A24 family peptidase [Aeromonas simiae]MDO2948252.1 A24 family peptidase [Aeromonas simiae]MDO2951733.1 A24 family peptidase [Aeromonas simiae]MDO2955559.1 A24 family peptidase [Aeromonas simiae]
MSTLLLLSQELPWLYFILIALFSLLIGSFLNVVIYRLPIMMERQWQSEYQDYFHPEQEAPSLPRFNLMLPRSACPHCGHAITALENIPIISWLVLRGRCRGCQAPISPRYPMVEATTALLSLLVAWQLPAGLPLLAGLLITWTLIALTLIDLDKMLLPDELTLPLLWVGLLINLGGTLASLEDAVIGAVAGYLLLWSLYWAFKLLTGKEGMGYGDFKLLAALGACLGWQKLPLILMLSALLGALVGILLIVLRRHEQGKPIPFGPYLALAGWVALLWGERINNWYLSTLL